MNFSVAINDSYKTKQGERKEQTTYYNCSYWINAKIAEYLIKGTLVELSGRISSSAWIGKDGEIKSGLNFHTSNIKLHGGKQKSEFNNEPTVSSQNNNSNPFQMKLMMIYHFNSISKNMEAQFNFQLRQMKR